jgi:hypothetical protein
MFMIESFHFLWYIELAFILVRDLEVRSYITVTVISNGIGILYVI